MNKLNNKDIQKKLLTMLDNIKHYNNKQISGGNIDEIESILQSSLNYLFILYNDSIINNKSLQYQIKLLKDEIKLLQEKIEKYNQSAINTYVYDSTLTTSTNAINTK